MKQAVIVSTARSGLAKSFRGSLNMTHGATLGAHSVAHAVERAGIEAGEVEDVLMGCATPEGATGGNIARQIALRAGLPVTVCGATMNRFCSSGLQTVAMAAQAIQNGAGPMVAGGVESISLTGNHRVPNHDTWLSAHKPEIYMTMIETADIVAERYGISRDAQDAYGLRSQQRMAAAQEAGKFADEIVPMAATMAVTVKTNSL